MIQVDGLTKEFTVRGTRVTAVQDASFTVDQGDFVTLVGPSGCGKSTLLQIMAGLVPGSRGTVRLRGTPVTAPPFELIYVFQQYTKSIFPWRTVAQNVAFGLANRTRYDRQKIKALTNEYISLMGLQGFASHYPWQLSGGMQQRVAIARALICQPAVLLMDEPFSSVDAMTRSSLQDLVLEIWKRHELTIIFVTHDIEEAVYLSNRVLVMSARPGRVVDDLAIQLPYPRNQLTTREQPDFLKFRHRIYSGVFGDPGQVAPEKAVGG